MSKLATCPVYFCAVPQCSVSTKNHPNVAFHSFPVDEDSRRKWHRRIRNDYLAPGHHKVCNLHFEDNDYECEGAQGRRLKQGAVPSRFLWDESGRESDEEDLTTEEMLYTVSSDHDYCLVVSELSALGSDLKTHDELLGEKERLEQEVLKQRFGLLRFGEDDEAIHLYTRFSTYEHLMAFWTLIKPATGQMVRLPTHTRHFKEMVQPGRLPPLSTLDEYFLFMSCLVQGLELMDLAMCFKVEVSTVSQIIGSWANFLYGFLGSVSIWMLKETVRARLPEEFKCYPDTQVVVDIVEFRSRRPASLYFQDDAFYAEHESDCTLKAMVGMAPHGALTFVSAVYSGSLSDEEVFQRSGIVTLLTPDTAIMVDEALEVDDLVPCKVHRLPFLSKQKEMAVYKMKRSTARLRMHVDMLFQRVREYALFSSIIPLATSRSLNQLFTVACRMVNYQNGPIGKTWVKSRVT